MTVTEEKPQIEPMLLEEGGAKLGVSKKAPQLLVASIVCLCAVLAGTCIAWSSPVLSELENENSTLPITQSEGSWISSLLAIGAIVGAPLTGFLVEKFGRKMTNLMLGFPFLASWALIVFTNSVTWLYIARILGGIATGGACVATPMYVSEISEDSLRGTLGAFFQLFLTSGILGVFAISSVVTYKVMSTCCGLITVIFVLLFYFFCPETPTYLLKINKTSDAKNALFRLRGERCGAERVLKQIQEDIDKSSGGNVSIKDLFSNRVTFRGLVATLGLMVFQQLSGINAVIFYSVSIFKLAGSDLDPAVSSIIIAAVQVVMSLAAIGLVEKFGRKTLLMISSTVMGICLAALGYYFRVQTSGEDVTSLGWLPLSSLVLFIVAFCIAYGPIPWMVMGEIFSADVKGAACSLTVIASWSLVFLVTKVFPSMRETLGGDVTFWIFTFMMIVATAFVFFLVPETKDKTLAEVQDELRGHQSRI
ncbi:facilitated trehalose transporter Tret1-like [Ctenocephalides felis]|uniref:facilitated trehalose transporter Tret1-like n=1 Tax=Ctenocephalides felis TaxID=7515 RepID=UPI000E6E54FA|nr:facilitated trehalose transporter Tret1-like [Ctenocephalides felis]